MRYLVEINLYTAIMLLAYMLLLRNRPMFRFNRIYLLATAVLPLLFPLIQLPYSVSQKVQAMNVLQFTLPEVTVGSVATGKAGLDITSVSFIVYTTIALALLLFFIWNWFRLMQIVRKNNKELKDGYVLLSNSGYGPGSFGKYIFFPDAEVNEAILAHEKAHIQLHHTRDLVFLNLLQALAWPSFMLGLVKKQLREVHEFQADAIANEDKQSYAELLLSATLNVRALPEMHLFIIHPLKRRIMMLQKNIKPSQVKTTLLTVSIALVLLCTIVFVQGCNKTEPQRTVIKTADQNLGSEGAKSALLVKDPEVMAVPTFDLTRYMVKNVHYPDDAKRQKIEGRVVVQFVVDENGAVKDVKVLKSPNESLSKEALKVVTGMAKWTPAQKGGKNVATQLTLPIAFRLN